MVKNSQSSGRKVSVQEERKKDFLDILKLFSPGTAIRTAVDDILRARMGALIVIDKENLLSIVDGGFRVNTKFSAQKLVELAKMDGAIILSEDLKKILYANTLLFPDVHLSTKETGTRHKAAERTAKQTKTIVIAVSQRKNKITIYYNDLRHELEDSSEVLRRASETLQILEKQKDIFSDLLVNLNILEINNLVTISDVCNVLQRIEIIKRVSEIVKRYLIELGREGTIVSMRLKELTKNIGKERELIIKDYFRSKASKVESSLEEMNFDFLLETSNLLKVLFDESHDRSISPSGIRILSKTNLNEDEIIILINRFKNLDDVLKAEKKSFSGVLKDEAMIDSFIQDIEDLKEKILVGKKL